MNIPTGERTFPLGFAVFEVGKNAYQLQKLDDVEEVEDSHGIKVATIFQTDHDAAAEVQRLADDGDEVCRDTIEFLIGTKSTDVELFKLKRTW